MGGSTSTTCDWCGRDLTPRYIDFAGQLVQVGYAPCPCPGATAQREREEREEARCAREREEARIRKKAAEAGIPSRFMDAESDLAPALWERVKAGEGLYIHGPVGAGKTHLACAVARLAIAEGLRVQFVDAPGMLRLVKATYSGEGTEEEAIGRLVRKDLLVIDDLGKEAPTEWTLQTVFAVVDGRWRDMRPVVVTSQSRRSGLAERLARRGDEETARAVVSRLAECGAVELDGPDRRLDGRKER